MFDRVAIIGVGLIGGSIGLALRQRRLARSVLGIGRSEKSLGTARAIGAVDEWVVGVGPELASAQVVIVAGPLAETVEMSLAAARHLSPGALLTDVGSVKAPLVGELEHRLPAGALFVGSHPIAGREKQGPQAAVADLFVGRTCVVTPTPATPAAALEGAVAFWQALDMRVVALAPALHDRILARTSHLPHFVAAALAATLEEADRPLAGTGFRDTTRIAAGSPPLWTDIFAQNRAALLEALVPFTHSLDRLREALERGDHAAMEEFLDDAKRRRESLGN